MKRIFVFGLTLCMCLILGACGGQGQQPSQSAAAAPVSGAASDGSVDVDLTQLSSTMVYSEVYNMVYTPEDYVGKTVKMSGQFAVAQGITESGEPDPDQVYFACIIADATACCSQGLEFVLAGDHAYPDDYPQVGTEITVTGEFQFYEENGWKYIHLVDAELSA